MIYHLAESYSSLGVISIKSFQLFAEDACLTRSPLWSHCQQLYLRTNRHVLNLLNDGDGATHQRQEYAKWLLQLGEGHLPNLIGTPLL